MFGRPRCREWTPLATQQLRLRSLIQIVGYNIRPPETCRSQCSFYLTLHHTTMSAPFYTSEKISSPHPKWKEIDPEIMQRMSSNNVVIRIWCHIIQPLKDKLDKSTDTIIQTWGVYFSGLRYIGANLALNFTSDCFKSNTLVFQMHGGYFCSYKSLKLDIIPPENELEHGSLSSDSSGKTNVSRLFLEPRFIQANRLKESRSVSPSKYSRRIDKEYSKSHSPIEQGFKQNFPTMRPSTSLNITHSQRDNIKNDDDIQQIYEQKPNKSEVEEFTISNKNCDVHDQNLSQNELTNSRIDLSETAESYDLRNEGEGTPKYRYLALNFLKSEIRQSYNANKLQKLHLLQYSIKKKQDAVQEIKESIYKKSAITEKGLIDSESDIRVKFKSRSQGNLFSSEESDIIKSQSDLTVKNGKVAEDKPISNGPRLTLKLNDLLSYKSKISPFQRSEHIRLTRQIEILRFKRIILSDERDSKLASIRRLKEKHAKLCEENQDVGLDLMENYHSLSRRNDILKETKLSCLAIRELAARSHSNLSNRRCELLAQLLTVFSIEQHNEVTWKILNIPLPICGDDYVVQNPQSDSIAAGYAAQLLCLTAAILNQPLRYQITLKGSVSEVLDANVDLPDPNIPLYVRSGDITLFRYGMFLLNKCIAQLLCGRGISVSNMRPTLHNLYTLISKPPSSSETSKLFGTYRWLADNQCPRTQSLRSLVASDRTKYRKFNRFKDAVDGQSPESVMNLRKHRHSKSVGSYVDQELSVLESTTTSIMGSEPNIYNTQLTQENLELQQRLLKSHSSDTEISMISDTEAEKVVFQLGDDIEIEKIESHKLVRISSNNGDEFLSPPFLNEDVKRICTEISGFCTANSDLTPEEHQCIDHGTSKSKITENVDVLDHRRFSVVPEEFDVSFDSCQANKDGGGLTGSGDESLKVNVIQGVEAILESGQSETDS